jgi:HNH endonuclease
MADRPFRSEASTVAEAEARDLVVDFLIERGFSDVQDTRPGRRQLIHARSPKGDRCSIVVKLCWRREPLGPKIKRQRQYAAAQLIAKHGGNPEGKVQGMVRRAQSGGVTHFLFIQPDDAEIVLAALIPAEQLMSVWHRQRDVSARLMEEGRITWNHYIKGQSPTIWLQDDIRGPEVAQALWEHSGVIDLLAGEVEFLPAAEGGAGEDEEGDFEPRKDDRRDIVLHQIRERRGRRRFRDALRQRYGEQCVVTGCQILDILEAAHIAPYRGEEDNHPKNGLLLRADIHTLFDLDLLGIDPDSLTITLHPDVQSDKQYAPLEGATLRCLDNRLPSSAALRSRFELFRRRLAHDGL